MQPRRSLPFSLLGLGVVAASFFLFAPTQLGGSTIYTATVGNSMEPMFHKGDLALTRAASSYKVGDVVLYESPVLHRPVLHRIIVIQGAHYYFKGDHNGFVDPGYVTRNQLLGKLWFHLPKVGEALSFVGKPSHAAGLAGIAVLLLILTGASKPVRRRRGRRRSTGRRPPMKTATAFSRLHGPQYAVTMTVAGVSLFLAALTLLVGFTTPLKRTAQVSGVYNQAGAFSYSGHVKRDSEYPTGVVSTGQPVILAEVPKLKLGFSYRFMSSRAHGIRGTIQLKGKITIGSSGWSRVYVLQPPVPFAGDKAAVSTTVSVHQWQALINQLALESGSVGGQQNVALQAIVHIRGIVDGKPIKDTFTPDLPFIFGAAVAQLDVAAPATLPGASYKTPTASATNAAGLNPVQAGSLPEPGPNSVTIMRFHVAVSMLRGLGIGLMGLTLLLILLFAPHRRRHDPQPLEERIAAHYGCVVVDVLSLEAAVASAGVPTEVPDFASLASFARYLERPILRDRSDGTFAVEDTGRIYLFRPQLEPQPDVTTLAQLPAKALEPIAEKKRRNKFARPLGGLVAVAIAVGLVTSFTATTSVPLSHAGVSTQARTLAQLTPSQCAGMTLSTLVVATGSSTTGTSGNDLILGKSGSGTFALSGGGGTDCIVAGGGPGTTNQISGSGSGKGDVCIGAPGATNNFTKCGTTY